MHSKMGRPKTGALGSFPAALGQRLKQMRSTDQGWGPTTLLVELQVDEKWRHTNLPSRSTIGRYLKQEQLSKRYEVNHPLPVQNCQSPKQAHELWQIDGQGQVQVEAIGPISMLNIKDVHSRVYVCSFPAQLKSMQGQPGTSDYQTAMRLGFIQHGLPQSLQSDHASVFYQNKSKSPFPTPFCLWLISLGIKPCFSRVNQPTDQGQVERAHQTLFDQVLRRNVPYTNWEALFRRCESRRNRLNKDIPSTATENLAPLIKFPEAKHSQSYYHPSKEAQLIDLKKVFAFLAKSKWYRQVSTSKAVWLGGQAYYLAQAKAKEQVLITFCETDQHLVFQNDKELVLHRLPIKGINKERLMGNLASLALFPGLQLELPLSWEAHKTNTTFWDSD